jgi:hypothetical protein
MIKIPTRLHGALDIVLGLALLIASFVSGAPTDPQHLVLLVAGAALILSALVTDFEWGFIRRLQIPVHLWIDAVIGTLLVISPWVLGFDRLMWVPHVSAGLLLMLIAFFTDTIPQYERRTAGRTTSA